MLKLTLAFLLLPATGWAASQVDIAPLWRGRPFLAISQRELQQLPPEQTGPLLLSRAALICEFLKAPAGRFRKYEATQVRSKPISSVGAEVAVLEKRSGQFQVKASKLRAGDLTESFTRMRCIGIP